MAMMIMVVVGAMIVAALFFVVIYNGLVAARNVVRESWAQIDVQLKRRHDLIPNLVETVKGYAAHEKGTLEEVMRARTQATAAHGPAAQGQAEQQLTGALGRLFAVAEQYPDLKANTNFLSLQEELASTENRIGFARQHFNDSVRDYNTRIQSIPANFFAAGFGFTPESFFELDDAAARQTPTVKF
jgi:LemA protein